MKYCPMCGKEGPDEARFCIYCGESLAVPAPETAPEAGYYRPAQAPLPELEPVVFVGFGQAIRNFFKNYVRFRGRATRAEFWFAMLFVYLVEFGLMLLFVMMTCGITAGLALSGAGDALVETAALSLSVALYLILIVFGLAILLPLLALYWRRLHDVGISGGWYFVGLVPLIGAVLLIVWCCMGSDGDNKYGLRKTASAMNPPALPAAEAAE